MSVIICASMMARWRSRRFTVVATLVVEVRETSGEVRGLPGKSGELPGNPLIAVKFHSERTSGEVTEKLPGKFGELPGKSGDFPEARGSLTPSQRLAKFVSTVNSCRFVTSPGNSSMWSAQATTDVYYDQESFRQTKAKEGRFMNFSREQM